MENNNFNNEQPLGIFISPCDHIHDSWAMEILNCKYLILVYLCIIE